MKLDINFYTFNDSIEENIKKCEGKHIQQVLFSTYHHALTQICFGCKKIRTTLKKEDLKYVDMVSN